MKKDISPSRQKLIADVTRRFTDAVRENQAATDVFDETLSLFLGINRTDGRCLDIIDRLGRISAGQLANESGLTTGAVTAVIDRLEAAGYVQRTRDNLDRRKIWVETTETMRTITGHIFSVYESVGPMMERYTPEQLAAIMEFLAIGKMFNLEMAAALREHLDPTMTSSEKRLAQALRFEKAMRAMAPRLRDELERLRIEPEGFR